MGKAKAFVKHLFYISGTTTLLDKLVYAASYFKNFNKNRLYRKMDRVNALPPEYFLYETYKLDYRNYIDSGNGAAREIMQWAEKYLPIGPLTILEWGCGVSRITRHIQKYVAKDSEIHACDINEKMIKWNIEHILNIDFLLITGSLKLDYPSSKFNFVYAMSVLTHIKNDEQPQWISEIHRIIKPGGIFLFTTHGTKFWKNLLPFEQAELETAGAYTKSNNKHGHRLTTAYNTIHNMTSMMKGTFEILEVYEGRDFIEKVGGQDLWIVRKLL